MAFRRSFDSLAGAFGRRRFLIGVLGAGVTLTHTSRIFAATEFWNAKDPSTWTEEEIHVLTSNSPWAKAAVPNAKGDVKDGDNSEDTSSGGGRAGRGLRTASAQIIVRWESAQPILDALKAPPPAGFEGHYIVSVTNLPIPNVRRPGPGRETEPDEALDRLQNGAILQAKGKDPAEAGIARRTRIGSILFGFSKEYLQLTPGDREIVFALDTEQLTIKAKFDGKEMIYHGKLAV